jgi:hypothetical protein
MYLKPINGGNKMKTYLTIALSSLMLLNIHAQDDIYYSGNKDSKAKKGYYFSDKNDNKTDSVSIDDYSTRDSQNPTQRQLSENQSDSSSTEVYRSENGDTYITNNYYNGDNYTINDNDDYYDYEYASRIRRFNRPYYGFGYYDDCYTNYYWYNYDPYYWGTSIYVSYNWWYPRPRFYWGWNSWTGWSAGWAWGYGCAPYGGYYGYSYWNGYNHGYWNGYWNGYYDGLYGSNYYPHYYNSLDNNSYYYGHRDTRRATGTYDNSTTGANPSNANLTFGEKYEKAIAKNNSLNTGTVSKPANNPIQTKNTPKSTTITKSNNVTQQTIGKTQTNTTTYSKPINKPITTSQTYSKPKTYSTSKPKQTYSKPKQTYSKPVYSKPKQTYNKPNTYSKPNNYTKPKTYSKPSYSKPSSTPSYSRPNSGGVNRSGGSMQRSSGSRRP